MKEEDKLDKVIKMAKKGVSFPAVKLVNENPELASVISKLIKPKDKSEFNIEKPNSYYALNQSQIESISNSLKGNIRDNKNIIQLFPDIELAIQILVSSILSPKDMVNSDIIYKNEDLVLNSELSMKINTVIKTAMEKKYKLHNKLEVMLRDMLFDTGSYVETVIPESIVDEVINANNNISTESLGELFTKNNEVVNLGILGNSGKKNNKPSLEALLIDSNNIDYNSSINTEDGKLNKALEGLVEVTDNYKLLKLPKVINAIKKKKIKSVISKESLDMTNTELSGALYKGNNNNSEQFTVFPSRKSALRKSVGRPLVMKLPSESVIPVHIPGDETKHVGYFVLIDIDGNPVTINSSRGDMSSGLSSLSSAMSKENTGGTQSLSSMLIKKARSNLVGCDKTITLDHITKVYTSIIEKDLMDRLKNGLYSTEVSISNDQEIYRVMLARALSGTFTRLVYIPEELMTYFAFKHHDNGVGKSLLDDIKILTSLRAIIMFSKVMAITKSSIALTRVNMTLDPNDPDPQKTIEIASHEIAKTRQQYFPLGINSPIDLVDWIQRAGFEFTFEGHPGLPETKFDFETKNIQHEVPDSELDELLRKQTYMAFGLSPEMVDNGFEGDFATTIVANNILLTKRILQLQLKFSEQLSIHVRKIVNSDPILQTNIREIILENKEALVQFLNDEDIEHLKDNEDLFIQSIIERHLESLEVELPKPDGVTLNNLSEAFNEYKDSLENAIEAWISTESLDESIAGEIANNVDSIKSVVTNYFLRKWMVNNGYMLELSDLTSINEDGEPSLDLYDISKTHLEGLIKSSITFIEKLLPTKAVTNKRIEELDNYEPPEASTEEPEETSGEENFDIKEPEGGEEESEEPEIPEGGEKEPEEGAE